MGETNEALDQLEKDTNEIDDRVRALGESWEKRMSAIDNSFRQFEEILFAKDATELTVMGQSLLEGLGKTLAKSSKEIIKEHKELHAPVSRVGKTLDKHMVKRISELMKQEKDLETDPKNLRLTEKMIADFFFSNGLSDVGEKLIEEGNLASPSDSKRTEYNEEEVKEIYQALENKKLQPAIEWLAINAPGDIQLRADLIKQVILEHIRNGDKTTARKKMRELAEFGCQGCERQMQEVARALSLGSSNPLCKTLFAEEVWPALLARLSQVIYQTDSSLDEVVTTGTTACVKMLNLKRQMRKDHVFTSDELPIQIPPKKTVHNTFTCPILRQQTTESNPPMRLLCGHVISKDALTKLSQATRNFRVKCPYCPSEGSTHDAKVVRF